MRVYLSSTFKDLVNYRRAVYDAIHKAGFECSAMENYAACDERPVDRCLEDVAHCDVYVGIFAHRYGYVPEGQNQSITEQECRKAESCGIPRLNFFVDEQTPWVPAWIDPESTEAGRKLHELKSELGRTTVVDFFKSADKLATKVLAALSDMKQRAARESPAASQPGSAPEHQPLRNGHDLGSNQTRFMYAIINAAEMANIKVVCNPYSEEFFDAVEPGSPKSVDVFLCLPESDFFDRAALDDATVVAVCDANSLEVDKKLNSEQEVLFNSCLGFRPAKLNINKKQELVQVIGDVFAGSTLR